MVVAERTADGVAHIVAESANAVELTSVCLHGEFLCRIGACSCTPTFTIHVDGRINLVECLTYEVHRFYVVYAHKVETESVDVVFLCPV